MNHKYEQSIDIIFCIFSILRFYVYFQWSGFSLIILQSFLPNFRYLNVLELLATTDLSKTIRIFLIAILNYFVYLIFKNSISFKSLFLLLTIKRLLWLGYNKLGQLIELKISANVHYTYIGRKQNQVQTQVLIQAHFFCAIYIYYTKLQYSC